MSIILKENESMQDVVEKLGFASEWVYEIAPIAYWYENLNENGRIKDIHFSRRMREILGYKSIEDFPDELNTLMTFTHPDDVQIMLQGAIDTGTGKTDKYDVQYRIRKADGSYMWCNATGQQIKNHDGVIVGMYGAFIDISEEIALKQEQEKRQHSRELIDSFAKNYEATFLGNLQDGSYTVISNKNPLYGFFRGNNTLPEAFKAYFEHVAHPVDRERIEKEHYTQEEIRNKFAIGEAHSLEYRRKIGVAYYWYRVAFNRINENEILVGFVNCDQEHTNKLVNDKLMSEYDAIYVVALDRGRIRPARSSRVSPVGAFSDDRDYSTMVREFAETVAPKYRQDWIHFSDPEYVKQYMAKDDHREYVYELPGIDKTMRRFSIDVIERVGGEAKSVLLSFVGIDDTRADAIRLHQQIAEQSAELAEINLRNAFLHKAVKASVWSYDINAQDEVIAAHYDEYASKNDNINKTASPMNWVEALHPEDRERVLGEFMAAIHDHSGNTPYDTTYRFKYSGGGYLWLKTYGKINRREDGTAELYGISVNITQQIEKEQEQKRQLQEAFDRVNRANRDNELVLSFVNGIKWSYHISADDTITAANYGDSALATYDANHPEDPMAWANLIHPEDKERVLAIFTAAVHDHSGKTQADTTYRIQGLDGNYHWTKISGRIRLNDDGTRELFGISVDVTEQMEKEREQQQQLQEALAMAQSASRAKTTFLNNMSHDIRTPMNAIIGFTGLAASHIDNKAQVRDYLTKIGQSSDHLLSLINDVLDMSRIESGKMNLDEKPENLPAIIHTLRDIVQSDIRSRQHDFFIDTVNVNDEDIVCDKLRLNQVLLNILSNAIKYTANGGTVSLRITEKAVKPSGYATYEFCIKDNGMGMDQEYLKTIFDPFTRMKSSTMSGIQGTGLGMAITKNIIDMMGGTIDIQSEPGKGTQMVVTFDFRLQSVPKETVAIPEFTGLRGLVVDDDADTCMSLTGMLRDIGMRDEWCVTGKEAVLRAAEAHRIGDSFKVYIIDWLMPDMNGIETTRRIRKVIGDDAPIIILTAYDWSDIETEAREAGVTAFISKPMFPSDLHRVLNNCLGKAENTVQYPPDDFDFTGKKILLVEDNELNREIGVELLTEYGCVIDTAVDGTIAVEKIKNAHDGDYDVILMDVQMPIMNGYEATKAIRALGTPISQIPILAMTADAFAEDRRHALEVGMNDHITKPIDIQLLRQTLAKYM